MAAFGGNQIFGLAVSMTTVDNPRAKQLNAYFGLSGLESVDGGSRGRVTHVRGLLYGDSPGSLAAAEAQFRSFNDGVSRQFLDTLGNTWANVRMEAFQPQGRIRQSAFGVLFRAYTARFLHLQ